MDGGTRCTDCGHPGWRDCGCLCCPGESEAARVSALLLDLGAEAASAGITLDPRMPVDTPAHRRIACRVISEMISARKGGRPSPWLPVRREP